MATIIDRLFVTFGLDPSEFVAGQKVLDDSQKKNRETSERTRKQFSEDGKKAVDAFRSIKNEVLGLVGAFVGLSAIKNFTSEITHSDAATARMAKTLGMSTPDLWTWEKAMAQFGVTAQETDSALSSLTDLAEAWRYGAPVTADMSRKLAQAGVDVVKFHDNSTTLEQRILMLAEAFKKVGPAAAEALGTPLGLGRQFIAELAINGPEAINAMRQRMAKMGPLSDAQGNSAIQREQEWQNMQTRIQGFERYLVTTFWPMVEPIIQGVMNWWSRNQVEIVTDLKAAVTFLGTEMRKINWQEIAKDIKAIAAASNDAAQAFGGWAKTIGLLLTAYTALKTAFALRGLLAMLGVGGGAAATAGTAGAAAAGGAGVGAFGAALLGLLGVSSAALLGLLPKGTDVIDSEGHGEDYRMEQLRKRQGIKGYGQDVYGPPASLATPVSTSQANYNITLYAQEANGKSIVKALDTYFHNLAIASPAQQGGR